MRRRLGLVVLMLRSVNGIFFFGQREPRRNRLQALARAYDNALRKYPIRTKMISSAILEMVGDGIAQRANGESSPKRTFLVCCDGFFTAAVLHHVYAFQDKVLPSAKRVWWVPFCNILVDETIVDLTFVASFILVTHSNWDRFLPTVIASKSVTLFTLPIQYLNFRFNPLRYRVFVVNLIDILWAAAVSFSAHHDPSSHAQESIQEPSLSFSFFSHPQDSPHKWPSLHTSG